MISNKTDMFLIISILYLRPATLRCFISYKLPSLLGKELRLVSLPFFQRFTSSLSCICFCLRESSSSSNVFMCLFRLLRLCSTSSTVIFLCIPKSVIPLSPSKFDSTPSSDYLPSQKDVFLIFSINFFEKFGHIRKKSKKWMKYIILV